MLPPSLLFRPHPKRRLSDPQCGAETAEHLIQDEQRAYLREMDVPPGIAANLALRENVFVMFVCVLNRIPCFCIGRPGSSKSLSLRILNASVRGEVRVAGTRAQPKTAGPTLNGHCVRMHCGGAHT